MSRLTKAGRELAKIMTKKLAEHGWPKPTSWDDSDMDAGFTGYIFEKGEILLYAIMEPLNNGSMRLHISLERENDRCLWSKTLGTIKKEELK